MSKILKSSTQSNISWTYNASSLAEYASILHQIDIIRKAMPNGDMHAQDVMDLIISHARAISVLYKQLLRLQNIALIGSGDLYNKCNTLKNRIATFCVALQNGGTPSDVVSEFYPFYKDKILNDILQDQINNNYFESSGALQMPIDETLFFEVFRAFNNHVDLQIGSLGDTLSIYSELFDALNSLNKACTWNPGTGFIDTHGHLTNKNVGDNWFALFNQTVDTDKVKGIIGIRQILGYNYFPDSSIEYQYIKKILNKIEAPQSEGGFDNLYSADTIKAMWEDKSFLSDVRLAIEVVSNVNENTQQEVNMLLIQSKTISDMTAKMLESQNEILSSIAKKVKH